MSLKRELETWIAALDAYDAHDFLRALELFSLMGTSSKIRTNMGLIYATLGEHDMAVEQFRLATDLDQYLAVAYFQSGVSNFLLGRYDPALQNFSETLTYLRSNQSINYHQLGLSFDLYSAEVLFNIGLSKIYLGQMTAGLADLESAQTAKAMEAHGVIDEAIRDAGEGYTVFSVPVGVIYRPPESKIKNCKPRDYMGKAKLIVDDSKEVAGVVGDNAILPIAATPVVAPLPDQTPPVEKDRGLIQRKRSSTTPGPNLVVDSQPKPSSLLRSNTAPARRGFADLGFADLGNSTPNLTRGMSLARPRPFERLAQPPLHPVQEEGVNHKAIGPNDRFRKQHVDLHSMERNSPTRQRGGGGFQHLRKLSLSPPSSTSSSSSGSLIVMRKPTRRPTARRHGRYEREEEEGYASGEYDDLASVPDRTTVMVKLHYRGDVRGMAIKDDVPFNEFMRLLTAKFNASLAGLRLKFRDEDGVMVSLRDESDYDLAIATAKEFTRGKFLSGKLAVWCTDV